METSLSQYYYRWDPPNKPSICGFKSQDINILKLLALLEI